MRSLIIHKTLFAALLALNDEDIGAVMRSAMLFTADEAHYVPPAKKELAFAWEVVKQQVIEHGKKYEEACQRKSEQGRLAAEARWKPSPSQRFKRSHHESSEDMPQHTDAMRPHRLHAK